MENENMISILGNNLKVVINHDRLNVSEAARMTGIPKSRMIQITKKKETEITKDEEKKIKLFLSIDSDLLSRENLSIKDIEEYRNHIRHRR